MGVDRGSLQATVVGIVVALAGLVVRWWQVSGRSPSWWQDSDDYLGVAQHNLNSSGFWVGERAPVVPLLLKATGGRPGIKFVEVQIVLAALAWGWLASELVRARDCRWWRHGIVGASVLAFSLSEPVALWDRSVLSESMTISLLAALMAAGLRLCRAPTWPRVGLFVWLSLWWVLTRDANAVALLLVAVAAGSSAWRRRFDTTHLRTFAILAAALAVVALGSSAVAWIGGRGDVPLLHVYQVRVLPYPDRVAWFAARGMPDGDRFVDASKAADPAVRPPVAGVGDADDPPWAVWRSWLAADGRVMFARFVLAHPSYLWSEPVRSPERVFNNAEGDVGYYAASDMPKVPFVSEVFWWPTPLVVTGAAVMVAARRSHERFNRGESQWSFHVVLVAAGSAAVAGFVAWHADGMESARHLVPATVGFRLAVLVGLAVAIGGQAPVRSGSSSATRADDGGRVGLRACRPMTLGLASENDGADNDYSGDCETANERPS